MAKETKNERTRRKLDLELDRQLEDTFPASDPLEITRGPPESMSFGNAPSDDMPEADQTKE